MTRRNSKMAEERFVAGESGVQRLDCSHEIANSLSRRIRDQFYVTMFEEAGRRPDQFVPSISSAWQKVMNAAGAEFWLHNEHTSTWELLYTTCVESKDLPINFPDINADGSRPIIDLACDSGEVLTQIPLTYNCEKDGRKYGVANSQAFANLLYRDFDAVPIVSANEEASELSEPPSIDFRAAICIHHREGESRFVHTNRTLTLMATITRLSLLRCYESQQRDVLLSLNGLVEQYSARSLKSPRTILDGYLAELLDVVSRYMRATTVSIFFHEDDPKQISCIATTGLADANGKKVPRNRLHRCKYSIEEHCWTSEVYRTGHAIIKTPAETTGHPWKFTEFDDSDFDHSLGTMGSVVCPILTPDKQPWIERSNGHAFPSLGVIRCSGIRNEYGTKCGTINSLGLQTLGLIAQQVGPFVELILARIRREETISLLKHDLFAPLNLISQTTDRLETDSFLPMARDRKIKFYDLMNIKSATLLARMMLPQLSLDPGDITMLAPTLISLENDIVRYLKQMLSHVARIENNMNIKFEAFNAIPELYLDKLSIQRALFNIIQNAIKYGDPGSTIEISARHIGQEYRVAIANHGIGVSLDDTELIFDIGFRSDKAKTHSQGTGNGLYVALKAMQLHKGTIELRRRSNPTVFELVFPAILRKNQWWDDAK